MSSTFALSTLALLLFAASLVLLLPRIWQRREQTETNIDWLRLRQAELPADAVALREEAALRLMEEGELDAAVALADRPRHTWAGQLMGIGLMVAGVWWLYQQLGGWEDVQIAGELASLEQATPEDVLVLIDRIELRAEQRQGNADYALLLAEYHLTGNNPARAVPYFERLIEAGATSPEILGKASQAEFLSSDRVLSPTARGRAEQALSIDPTQPAALATLGMAAFEEADYVTDVLTSAGFGNVAVTPLKQQLTFGRGLSLTDIVERLVQIGPIAQMVREAPEDLQQPVREKVTDAVAPFYSEDAGMTLDGQFWQVTARR